MDSIINYILRAELHNRVGAGKLQSCLFERKYQLKYIKKDGRNSVVFDPELNMYFENEKGFAFVYEIEIENTSFILSNKLEKATDFIRRINYMYDWAQLQTNKQGKLLFIKNEEELKQKWGKIKKTLLADYKGKEVEVYLKEIDSKFADSTILYSSIHQYFNFGLLFPSIPCEHRKQWQTEREIEFSEYEKEKFQEQIIFQQEENNQRIYSVIIKPLEDSNFELEQYEGSIIVPSNDIFPVSALIEVVFRKDNIANQWYFKLERTN